MARLSGIGQTDVESVLLGETNVVGESWEVVGEDLGFSFFGTFNVKAERELVIDEFSYRNNLDIPSSETITEVLSG